MGPEFVGMLRTDLCDECLVKAYEAVGLPVPTRDDVIKMITRHASPLGAMLTGHEFPEAPPANNALTPEELAALGIDEVVSPTR